MTSWASHQASLNFYARAKLTARHFQFNVTYICEGTLQCASCRIRNGYVQRDNAVPSEDAHGANMSSC